VFENKAALERLLQRPVHLFSYPYGELDADTLTVVKDAGFRAPPSRFRPGSSRPGPIACGFRGTRSRRTISVAFRSACARFSPACLSSPW
jgi:peptidoglycan/xylan/chitin deacetylase (PgdA/CDA1 family)